MARDLLSNLSDWRLVYAEQDVRGRDVYSDDGVRLGTVTGLIADTEQEAIVAIALDSGQEYPASQIEIEKDSVRVHTTAGSAPAAATAFPVAAAAREAAPGDADYSDAVGVAGVGTAGAVYAGTPSDALPGAPSETFAGADGAYAGTSAAGTTPAYELADADRAFFSSRRSAYSGRTWDDALEADLRRDYETEYGEGTWERIKHGAREAWENTKDAVADVLDGPDTPVRDWSTDWAADAAYFHEAHRRSPYGSSAYDDYEPFYRYGYEAGHGSAYAGREWDALEPDMRLDYEGRYGEGTWERVKDSVREGFQRARNAVTGGDDGSRATPY